MSIVVEYIVIWPKCIYCFSALKQTALLQCQSSESIYGNVTHREVFISLLGKSRVWTTMKLPCWLFWIAQNGMQLMWVLRLHRAGFPGDKINARKGIVQCLESTKYHLIILALVSWVYLCKLTKLYSFDSHANILQKLLWVLFWNWSTR